MSAPQPPAKTVPLPPVDIELILEGSYPYVTGGVSSWVHRLIEGLPDLSFGLTYLGATREKNPEPKYQILPNVQYLQNLYLHDAAFYEQAPDNTPPAGQAFFHELFRLHHQNEKKHDLNEFRSLFEKLGHHKNAGFLHDMFFNREGFSLLLALYQKNAADASFLDFFWTWRFMHLPLTQIMQMRRPPARLCHAVCTGYAGFYGALRKLVEGIPLLLTEHGIYTRERTIEITQAEWIFSEKHPEHIVRNTQGTFKRLWLKFFQSLSSYTYQMANRIITLYDGNRTAQIAHGADSAKIEIIPNGISLPVFADLRRENPPDPQRFVVGFIGRIVPIKDVKTFLKAAQIVLLQVPEAEFWLIGPLDEEPDYALEMQTFADSLGISKQTRFWGKQNVLELYPRIDLSVLTSISEGQPLTTLEAMAAGIPNVATDVGSCRELLYGRSPEDKALGSCGIVTHLRSPTQTAQAILDICTNPETFRHMAKVGKTRAKTFYQQAAILSRYQRLYQQLMLKDPVMKED
jgi:glycosyltransferase involved in cell wall biosynthesis